MRSEWTVLALVGCAFGKAPGPTTAEGVVANLLADRLVEGAAVLVAPGGTGWVNPGPGVALVQETAEDGSSAGWLAVVDGGEVRLAPVPGFPGPGVMTLASVGDLTLLWACGRSQAWILEPGDVEANPVATSLACPTTFGADADGGLLSAEWTADGFVVRGHTVEGDAITDDSATTLPAGTANQAFRVGDDGDGPWVVGGTYGDLVWSGPDGTAILPGIGLPSIVVRDGDDVRVAPEPGLELYRWTPETGESVLEDVAPVDGASSVPSRSFDGTIAFRSEAWGSAGASWTTDAWWLTPGADGFDVADLPPHPCHDEVEAADVGVWSPAAVLDSPEGRVALWTVTSWLGPTATIAAPF